MAILSQGNAKATLTEKTLSNQSEKVFIVTGGNAGIGLELVKILYAHNGTVYVAGRSESRCSSAIESVKALHPQSQGKIHFLHLDLGDLSTIKTSADQFLRQETRLDVLWNNAGVMIPPQGSLSTQSYELQLGTNCLGPFLFTKFLTPLMCETAKNAPASTVRVVWLSSSAAARFSPPGGVEMENLSYGRDEKEWHKYGVSKAGNILYGTEFAKRFAESGVLSLSADPGNLDTGLYKHMGSALRFLAKFLALSEPIYGAYTELFAGLSSDIGTAQNGAFIQPWGKIGQMRKDIELSTKSASEGGTGVAAQFWDWSETQVAQFA